MSLVRLLIFLFKKGDGIGIAYLEEGNTVAFQNDQLSLQSTLQLKAGDEVWVILPGVYLADNGDHYTPSLISPVLCWRKILPCLFESFS